MATEAPDRRAHWEQVYTTKAETAVSWFESTPAVSLALIRATGAAHDDAIIDIGGGASRLVDHLLAEGYAAVSVLDLSERALAAARVRLGQRAAAVTWIAADVTAWEPDRTYAVWHDRAAFHFLTAPQDRAAYAARVLRALPAGGHLILGTFAPDGPERCSGLPVQRHDAASLAEALGPAFALQETRPYDHRTPGGVTQRFQFSRFRRV